MFYKKRQFNIYVQNAPAIASTLTPWRIYQGWSSRGPGGWFEFDMRFINLSPIFYELRNPIIDQMWLRGHKRFTHHLGSTCFPIEEGKSNLTSTLYPWIPFRPLLTCSGEKPFTKTIGLSKPFRCWKEKQTPQLIRRTSLFFTIHSYTRTQTSTHIWANRNWKEN